MSDSFQLIANPKAVPVTKSRAALRNVGKKPQAVADGASLDSQNCEGK
jgi:hypothetical protein